MEHADPTLRLRCRDGEVFEVGARRLAALFRRRVLVLSVPAIANSTIFRHISAYRRFEASGLHTAPDVESDFIEDIGGGGLVMFTRIVSAAMQLGDDALLNLCLRATIVIIVRARVEEIRQNLQRQLEK